MGVVRPGCPFPGRGKSLICIGVWMDTWKVRLSDSWIILSLGPRGGLGDHRMSIQNDRTWTRIEGNVNMKFEGDKIQPEEYHERKWVTSERNTVEVEMTQ